MKRLLFVIGLIALAVFVYLRVSGGDEELFSQQDRFLLKSDAPDKKNRNTKIELMVPTKEKQEKKIEVEITIKQVEVKIADTQKSSFFDPNVEPVTKHGDFLNNQKKYLELEKKQEVKSKSSGGTTTITFTNYSYEDKKLYWLDYSGKRKLYKILKSGDRYTQSTFKTHPWLITDAKDNALSVHYPDAEKEDEYIVIE